MLFKTANSLDAGIDEREARGFFNGIMHSILKIFSKFYLRIVMSKIFNNVKECIEPSN